MAFGDNYVFLDFTIYLTDAEEVAELQAAPARIEVEGKGESLRPEFFDDPGTYYTSPQQASLEYGAPIYIPTQPMFPPGITSPWITGSGANYPIDEARFVRSRGGWFGISALFGEDTIYRWRGKFELRAALPIVDGVPVGSPAVMPARYWIDGFESAHGGYSTGGSGVVGLDGTSSAGYAGPGSIARDASRHTDGYGLRVTGASSSATIGHHPGEHVAAGSAITTIWHRIYLRPRQLPNNTVTIFRQGNTGGASRNALLQLTAQGQLVIAGQQSGSTTTMLTTTEQLVVDTWYKIDMLLECGAASKFMLYVNGALLANVNGFGASGFGTVGSTLIAASLERDNIAGMIYAIDWDDWTAAAWPLSFDSFDWLNGTRITRLPPSALSSHVSGVWTGGYAAGNAWNPAGSQDSVAVGAGSDARFGFLLQDIYEQDRGYFAPTGCLSVMMICSAASSMSIDQIGALGYVVAGGAPQTSPKTFATAQTNRGLFRPGGGTVLGEVIKPTHVLADHETGTNIMTIQQLTMEVELIGNWGREDISSQSTDLYETITSRLSTGKHNAPYPGTPWAYQGAPPYSPVALHSFTFVGDGALSRELTFNFPPCFIWIRPTTVGNMGAFWFPGMNHAHLGHQEGFNDAVMFRARANSLGATMEDQQEYDYKVLFGGTVRRVNEVGITYTVFAFMDPGMRFSLSLGLANGENDDAVTRFVNPAFLPSFTFVVVEPNNNTTTNAGYIKGTLNTTDSVTPMSALADVASGLSIVAGQATIRPTLAGARPQIALLGFRPNDGSGDPGVPVAMFGYTGDGAASRSLAVNLGGKRPLWAMVIPHTTAAAVWRDPENTGTTSNTSGTFSYTSNASTGITAGAIDGFTVGSALNTNGVNYDVVVFPGSSVAGNGGWSPGGEYIPVQPDIPEDWPFDPTIPDIPEPVPPGWYDPSDPTDPEEPVEPGGEDFGTQCVSASTKVCNQALSFIGINQLLVDVTTDLTPEASQCRLHYADAVAEALREFPWAFATKYAHCARVSGTELAPYSGDWTYAYRMPEDAIFARRIVRVEKRRTPDPDPPQFRQGPSDSVGRLILSDYVDPDTEEPLNTIELEYTYRPNCAATQGDALFRQALAWLVAHKLAPSLSRNKVTAVDCWRMYLDTGNRAMTVNAREQQQNPTDDDAPWIKAR